MEVEQPEAGPSTVSASRRPIQRLDKDVINKIAAAEIIHRPANAIKELLENSLDAGSTSIKLTIKEGGLKLIQITDNGHGINRSDLPLLCTRYATSKLREYKDLESIATYGFRGEALASISYCSHVEVVTKTKEDTCGWKASYLDGELVPGKAGGTVDPKPAAANDGTIISAEDLFFNMPLRKRAFKSAAEEYNRVLDVVTKYAVHNPHCAWVCKKAGSNLPDLSTPAGAETRSNISLLYGPSLAAELLPIPPATLKPDLLGAKCQGWVSNANSSWARKGGWLLFINNRLVESSKIRKAIESMYTAFLPKGAAPWMYLSLEIDPAKVDVNVHPTKSEVHFLNEDEMIEAIVSVVHDALKGANASRSFTVQTLLPGASEPVDKRAKAVDEADLDEEEREARRERRKAAPNYKVRTDLASRTLDSMLGPSNPSQRGEWMPSQSHADETGEGSRKKRRATQAEEGDILLVEDETDEDDEVGEDGVMATGCMSGTGSRVWKGKQRAWEVNETACEFTSIQELRRAVKKRSNTEMNEALKNHSFVGVVDREACLGLIQHSTKLHLVNYAVLADEHFYQLGLKQFGALDRIRLDPPPDMRELLRLAIDCEPLDEHDLDPADVLESIRGLLMDKREMIDEYFSLNITEEGFIECLPLLVKGYSPDLDRLPHFLLCLGTQVDWTSEKECFQSILKELAFFFSPRPLDIGPVEPHEPPDSVVSGGADAGGSQRTPSGADADMINSEEADRVKREEEHRLWQLEHVLFPSFKHNTLWPAMGRDVVQIANLPDLFRIFERC